MLKKIFAVTLFLLMMILQTGLAGTIAYQSIIDDHNTPLPSAGFYYSALGGDRGTLNDGDFLYARHGDSSYSAKAVSSYGSWTWGGMWYSFTRINRDQMPLNFKAIFGPYIKPEYQGSVTNISLVLSKVYSHNSSLFLRIELKDIDNGLIASKEFHSLASGSFPKTLTWTLSDSNKKKINTVLWIVDRAQPGDDVIVEKVLLGVRVPDLIKVPTADQGFLWSTAWLLNNYNPKTGITTGCLFDRNI